MFERRKIKMGEKVQIKNLKIKETSWTFKVHFSKIINNSLVIFDNIILRIKGECYFKDNDWVRIRKIIEYKTYMCTRNDGVPVKYTELQVEVDAV